jgi:hypothetical protein
MSPYPLPLTHCIRVSCILNHTGKGERTEPERMLEEQQFTKLDRKYQHDCIFSLKTKHLPQVYRSIFWYDDILLVCLYSWFVNGSHLVVWLINLEYLHTCIFQDFLWKIDLFSVQSLNNLVFFAARKVHFGSSGYSISYTGICIFFFLVYNIS